MTTDGPTDRKINVDVVEAKAIYLVDDSGTSRASLTCSSGEQRGHVVIHLYDGEGRPRISLQVDDDEGASISLFNGTNSPCVSLGVFNSRGNGITVGDADGKPMINIGAIGSKASGEDKSKARISVLNSLGEEIWSIP